MYTQAINKYYNLWNKWTHLLTVVQSLIEYNNVIYESYLYYILMQKQYDISGMFLGNPRDFYYLHYILIQKQYDISGSLLCNARDFYYLHYILIQKQYDISGSLLFNPGDLYYRQDIKL